MPPKIVTTPLLRKKKKEKRKSGGIVAGSLFASPTVQDDNASLLSAREGGKVATTITRVEQVGCCFLFLFSRRAHVYLVTFVSCHGAARIVHRSDALFDLESSTPRSWKDECIHTRRVAGLPRSARPTAPCDDGTRRHTRKRVQVTHSLCGH